MRTLIVLVLALCVAGPALAEGYDYIRGDDIFQGDYNYGLHYDRLTSLPQLHSDRDQVAAPSHTPKLKSHHQDQSQSGRAGYSKTTRFPNMNAEIRQFRQQALDAGTPGNELDTGLSAETNPYSDLNLQDHLRQNMQKMENPDQ